MLVNFSKIIKDVASGSAKVEQLNEVLSSSALLLTPPLAAKLAREMEINYPSLAAKLWYSLLSEHPYASIEKYEPIQALKRLNARDFLIAIVREGGNLGENGEEMEKAFKSAGLAKLHDLLSEEIKGSYPALKALYELKDEQALSKLADDTTLFSGLREQARRYLEELGS